MAYGVTKNNKAVPQVATKDHSIKVLLSPQKADVTPNLKNANTRMEWTNQASWDLTNINFNTAINVEDRSLHWLKISNVSSNRAINITFSADWILMDNPNTTQTIELSIGQIVEFYITSIQGQLYLKTDYKTTNTIFAIADIITTEDESAVSTEDDEALGR